MLDPSSSMGGRKRWTSRLRRLRSAKAESRRAGLSVAPEACHCPEMTFKVVTDKQGTSVEYKDASYTYNEAGFLVIHHADGRRTTLSAVAWYRIEEPPPDKDKHVW